MKTYRWTKTGLTVKSTTRGEIILYSGKAVEQYRGRADLQIRTINDYGVTILEKIEHDLKGRVVRKGY